MPPLLRDDLTGDGPVATSERSQHQDRGIIQDIGGPGLPCQASVADPEGLGLQVPRHALSMAEKPGQGMFDQYLASREVHLMAGLVCLAQGERIPWFLPAILGCGRRNDLAKQGLPLGRPRSNIATL